MARDSSSSPRDEQASLTHTHPEPQDGSVGSRVLAEVITVRVRVTLAWGQAVQHLVSS